MKRIILRHCLVPVCAVVATAAAKPRASCEADFALVARVIADHHVDLPVRHQNIFVMEFPNAELRSRKAARIFETIVGRNCLSAGAYSTFPSAAECGGVVRSRDEFRDKRKLARFAEVRFLLIDTVESFLFDLLPEEREANARQLRDLIAGRVRERLTTLLVFEDPTNFDRYLGQLPIEAKSAASSVKK